MLALVTGAAGFIGFHLSKALIKLGNDVIGIDNLNDYYDTSLKHARLAQLTELSTFTFRRVDIRDSKALGALFSEFDFKIVVNLAAQPGVRYSISNPMEYIDNNINGFANVLECCRHQKIEHLIYASSSSVYGLNQVTPFSEKHHTSHPASLYAATKKSNELLAHSYSHLYHIKTTGLRFFTVYGPWGRPDMAYFLFSDCLLTNLPIKVFNNGHMYRDFTYIEDIIDGILLVIAKQDDGVSNANTASPGGFTGSAPHQIFNIGSGKPIPLAEFIDLLEESFGKTAQRDYLPMQPGDVVKTYADISLISRSLGYKPKISLEEGVAHFVEWYHAYQSSGKS